MLTESSFAYLRKEAVEETIPKFEIFWWRGGGGNS